MLGHHARPLLEGLEPRQLLTAYLVDTLVDESDGSYGTGDLSLREAVILANGSPGADEIAFAAALSGGTITLSGEISVTDDLTIAGDDEHGADADMTVSGSGTARLFSIGAATVTLEGLALTGGAAGAGNGGAVYAAAGASVTITGCTLEANSATYGGAVYVDGGAVVIDSSAMSGNTAYAGGAVRNSGGVLAILGCTLSGNSSTTMGGALYNDGGALAVYQSTLSGNDASDSGGAIFAGLTSSATIASSTLSGNSAELGGAIRSNGGTMTISSSTISGNSSARWGGAIYSRGVLEIIGSTIASNLADSDGNGSGSGGGIFASSGTVTLTSTIVAGNVKGAASDPSELSSASGTFDAASSFNLIGDADSADGLDDGVNGNIVGADPLLGSLGDNGGSTQTHALLPGSPALHAGDAAGATTDQRGYARTGGAGPDIGAVEAHAPTIVALSPSLPSIFRGEELTLTADGAADDDENLASVWFYADTDGDGEADAGELLGADSDGTDGYSLVLSGDQTAVLEVGELALLAIATDGLGFLSDPAAASVEIEHRPPSIGGLETDVPSLFRWQVLTLTAHGVADGDGAVAEVRFYLDQDGDGLADSAELLATDGDGADGYAVALTGTQTAAFPLGEISLLAVALDSLGFQSDPAPAMVTVECRPPSIGALGAGPSSIFRGDTLALTASGVQDGDAPVVRVWFYTDADADGVAEPSELLGSDADGSNGFALHVSAEQTSGFALGGLTLLAVAEDALGNLSGPTSAGVLVEYRPPSLTGLSPSAPTARRGDPLTLTATGVRAGDAQVTQVAFYLDADGDGEADAEELLGIDTDGADGYSLALSGAQSAALEPGLYVLLAVATDAMGFTTEPAAADLTVVPTSPTIAGLEPDGPAVEGRPLRLTATGVSDLGAGSSHVAFYLDTNGDGAADEGELLAIDEDASDGYAIALTDEQVTAIGRGEWSFLAVATDALGERSDVVSTRISIAYSVHAAEGAPARGATSLGTHVSIVRNTAGDLVAFIDDGDGAHAVHLGSLTGAPRATDDPVIWTDVKDGLVYAAAPSAQGLILYMRDADGSWSSRNLAAELGVREAGPVGVLTQFTSTAGTGRAVVIAGVNAAGQLVAFRQTTDGGWTFVNISDDLASQGMATPVCTSLTSYVTPWNAWTIAGIDANGDIQGIWVAPGSFAAWRVDNLSAITGAPALTGGLTVTQTAWGAINIGGVDARGRLVVTWWLPGFGGAWVTSDLTAAAQGPALAPGEACGFVTPWGAISYAGLSGDGEVLAYWWTPAAGAWRVSSLTGGISEPTPRPARALSGDVSERGAMSIHGVGESGEVLRLWWSPDADDTWRIENLSSGATRS